MSAIILLFLGAVLTLFLGVGKKEKSIKPVAIITVLLAAGLAAYEWMARIIWGQAQLTFGPEKGIIKPQFVFEWLSWQYKPENMAMLSFDQFGLPFIILLCLITVFVLGLFKSESFKGADLIGLMLFSLCGAMLMSTYNNLVMLFLGIETLSIPLYVLAGSLKENKSSNEAAMKYFIMGAVSTAVFLLGCALIYGGTNGSMDIGALRMTLSSTPSMMAKIGVVILLAAMLFKIGAVPFHFWTPDVYEGSPTRPTAFMATVAKFAAVVALVRFLFMIAAGTFQSWIWFIAIFSVLSVLIGNMGALVQKSSKRILSYSSIAHVGYFLIGFLLVMTDESEFTLISKFFAIMLYGLAYAMGSLLLFFGVQVIEHHNQRAATLEDFKGLIYRNKWAGLSVIIGVMSLAGIPLTAGFAGKLKIFMAAWHADWWWVIVVALIGSAISIAYYFQFVRMVVTKPSEEEATNLSPISLSLGQQVFSVILVILVFLVGIYPNLIVKPYEYERSQMEAIQKKQMEKMHKSAAPTEKG